MWLQQLGNTIKYLRENKEMSQSELSKKAGVNREQISRIESGQVNVTVKTIYKLAEALNVPISFFFKKTEEYKYNDDIRPFVKWAGGKTQLLDKIISLLPEQYNTYYEPFIGGGALFFKLQPKNAVINDFNNELMDAYRSFQNEEEFKKMITKIIFHEENHNEDYYYKVRELDRNKDYKELETFKKSARLIYLNKACFNGLYRVNSKGYFNVPSGKKEKVKAYDEKLFNGIHNFLKYSNVIIKSEDFEKSLRNASKGDFVYFDPPYDVLEDQNNFTTYTKQGFGKEEQKRLANVYKELDKKGVKLMLSNHNTPYINELYSGFNIHVIKAKRMINSIGNKRGYVEEVLITNY